MAIDLDAVFAKQIEATIGLEGGYTNDPRDSGGETMWGITIARARAAGYLGAMSAMSKAQAIVIYRLYYWTQPGFDKIAAIDLQIGLRLTDGGINCGQAASGAWLQRALNVLNQNASIFPDLTVDGSCGAMTRTSMIAFLRYRGADGAKVLLFMIQAQQAVHYIEVAESRPKDEAFVWGQELNRAMGDFA